MQKLFTAMSGDPPAAESLLFNENCFLECNNHIPESSGALSHYVPVLMWQLCSSEYLGHTSVQQKNILEK